MLGRLFKWVLMAGMLVTVVWHYRDTDVVRQRRPLIEAGLAKVGVDEAFVRRYWPMDVPQNTGSEPLVGDSSANVPSAPSSAPPSAWDDLLARFSPITMLRGHIDPPKPAASTE